MTLGRGDDLQKSIRKVSSVSSSFYVRTCLLQHHQYVKLRLLLFPKSFALRKCDRCPHNARAGAHRQIEFNIPNNDLSFLHLDRRARRNIDSEDINDGFSPPRLKDNMAILMCRNLAKSTCVILLIGRTCRANVALYRRKVTFIDKDGDSYTYEVADGDNLLDIAQANDLEVEGACGGSCACSTCHVIVDQEEYYDKMEEPSDDENDMLDLAFGLTETSRLGCQVKMRPDLDGLVVKLPQMTRNMQASDFKDK